VTCRLCAAEALLWIDRGDLSLHRCSRCGFVSGKPAVAQDAVEQYDGYYSHPAPPAPEARYHEWLARAEAEVGAGRLLEVGAGSGALARVALRRGWKVDATEISRSGLQALGETGAAVFAGPVEEAGYADGRFDLVVSLEVLEHVPAPLVHLKELARVTRPGGLLLLTTPNFGGLSRRWLGAAWRVVGPEHLGYFTPRTLGRALKDAGYRGVRLYTRSLDISTWRRSARGKPATFDPHASARLRDEVESRALLRAAKDAVNLVLSATGLGDSLLTWARR
jgi:2-polyprenyl-3-methyl-5-hydroxy-6-metoxy-1,4-benzoquinol methylase